MLEFHIKIEQMRDDLFSAEIIDHDDGTIYRTVDNQQSVMTKIMNAIIENYGMDEAHFWLSDFKVYLDERIKREIN